MDIYCKDILEDHTCDYEIIETHPSVTSTHIFCFCLLHTYDKQYNVTRSSRYGILENFHYPLLQLLFDVLFRHISSIFRVSA